MLKKYAVWTSDASRKGLPATVIANNQTEAAEIYIENNKLITLKPDEVIEVTVEDSAMQRESYRVKAYVKWTYTASRL